MIYEKLICVNNNDPKLTVNKQYLGEFYHSDSYSDIYLYIIFDYNYNKIGIFDYYLFEKVKQFRKKRLKKILNESNMY